MEHDVSFHEGHDFDDLYQIILCLFMLYIKRVTAQIGSDSGCDYSVNDGGRGYGTSANI